MKFEKLNENKIRIILNIKDLEEKNIDFHSFVSQSIESQKLFLDMLDEAEEKIGFITKDHKLVIEALALTGGDFILTVTKLENERKKVKIEKPYAIKRKIHPLNTSPLIYSFNTFEDFCNFCTFLNNNMKNYIKHIKNDLLYTYNSIYYLIIDIIDIENNTKKKFYSYITEFGEYVKSPEIFDRKLREYGKLVMPKNAIRTCIRHFVSK